jgi:hypothetical protein
VNAAWWLLVRETTGGYVRQLLFAAGVLSVIVFATSARSQPTEQTFTVPTTAALAELCATTSSSNIMMTTAAQNFCRGYMVGAYQILAQINAARAKPDFCIPTPAPTRNQAIAAFVSWVKENHSAAGLPPADGVYEFLIQHFPCPATR